jgi:hypothetical protein
MEAGGYVRYQNEQKQNLEVIFAFHSEDPLLRKGLLIQNKRAVARPQDLAGLDALM